MEEIHISDFRQMKLQHALRRPAGSLSFVLTVKKKPIFALSVILGNRKLFGLVFLGMQFPRSQPPGAIQVALWIKQSCGEISTVTSSVVTVTIRRTEL